MEEVAQAVMNPALQVNVTISLTENQLSNLNEYVKDHMAAYRRNNIELYSEVVHNTCPACRECEMISGCPTNCEHKNDEQDEGGRATSKLIQNVEKRMEERFKHEFIARTFLSAVNTKCATIHDF
ncbi:MAG: hypothetical protein K2M73_08010 [Lachnospiraceae bacterium]|nr:hypothetical protein [Lachnospiraceae bacterium]